MIPLMTKLDEPFSGVDGFFKLYVDKLIPIHVLLTIKTTEYMGYDIERLYY